jgi:anthranilate 1,2-dioxygenase ferredoxin subunit
MLNPEIFVSETYLYAADESAISDNAALGLILNGWPVLLSRGPEGIAAVIDRCTHAAAALSPGRIRRGTIMCPLHGARFEMTTGKCIGGAYRELKRFETRIVDGRVEVLIPDETPGPEHAPIPPS